MLLIRALWRSGIGSGSLGSGVAVEGRPEEVDDVAASNSTIHIYRYLSTQNCNEDPPAKTWSAECTLKCVNAECGCTCACACV